MSDQLKERPAEQARPAGSKTVQPNSQEALDIERTHHFDDMKEPGKQVVSPTDTSVTGADEEG